jgi:hypothetical protein
LTSNGRATELADIFAFSFIPAFESHEQSIKRAECQENMQRLALAILLYQNEHGTMPGENWAAQIEKYLEENADDDGVSAKYFSCPLNPLPKGETTYAMVQYGNTGDAVAGSLDRILLIELYTPVPFDKAVVSVDWVIEFVRDCKDVEVIDGEPRWKTTHPGGRYAVLRNGAVRFLSDTYGEQNEQKLRRMLELPVP